MAGLFRRITEKLFTSKSAPVRTDTRARQVRDRKYGGDTKRMAQEYGVTPRTIQRWIDGSRKNPPKAAAARLEEEATVVQTTPAGRERKARQIEGEADSGIRLRVSRAGTFQIKGSDAVRPRDVDLYLTGEEAARFARATTEEEAKGAVGAALARYFNGGPYGGFQGGDFTFETGDVSL
jgi:DNA-binding transcriptional regulator YdaS (Cro superfamily)